MNYLYITSEANRDLGDLSIKDKIDALDRKGRAAFSSELSYKYFQKAKEVFEDDGSYPDVSSTNKSKSQAALRKYYKEKLVKIMVSYIDSIKSL